MFPALRPALAVLLAAGGFFPTAAMAQDAGPSPAPCDGDVWCGLYLSMPGGTGPGTATDAGLDRQLRKAFPGLGSFRLVGENTGSLFKEYECWFVPSRQLFLKLDSLGPQPEKNGVHLHLQLWQREHVILKTDAILRQRPLIIAGPQYGEGRLIMVVKLAGPGD